MWNPQQDELAVEARLHVLNLPGEIAAAHAELDWNVTLAIFAVNHESASCSETSATCPRGTRFPSGVGSRMLRISSGVRRYSGYKDDKIEAAVALQYLRWRKTSDGSLHGGVHVGGHHP